MTTGGRTRYLWLLGLFNEKAVSDWDPVNGGEAVPLFLNPERILLRCTPKDRRACLRVSLGCSHVIVVWSS